MKLVFMIAVLAILGSGYSLALDWTTSYEAAVRQAKLEHKLILLNFTGTGWCSACKLLHQEVLSRGAFKEYAKATYELVTIDFPGEKALPQTLKGQNDALSKKYGIIGFPTLLVLDATGKEKGRIFGYGSKIGYSAIIAQLKSYEKL